jgi:hypothetical protein
MAGATLRDCVTVSRRQSTTVELRHPLWTLNLPAQWVDGVPKARAFLDRRAGTEDAAGFDRQLDALLALLGCQGGLSAPVLPRYSPNQLRRLFHAVILEWYADYFTHPLWRLLQNGELSRVGLVTWVVHNYMVSRSVGMTAARAAVRSTREQDRLVFLESALDEYAHCRDYFHVANPRLGLSTDDLRGYVPLPSNTAFDYQMLRLADEDVLAHMLVGYMQEYTARFIGDYEAFYAAVENSYGIASFFAPWLAHVRLDLDLGHADGFARALEEHGPVARDALEGSLSNAWAAFAALRQGLDEIVTIDRIGDGAAPSVLRQRLHPGENQLRGFVPPIATWNIDLNSVTTYLEMADRVAERVTAIPVGHIDSAFLRTEFGRAALAAMAHSNTEPEVLMTGDAVAAWAATSGDQANLTSHTSRPWATPAALYVANLVRESATEPYLCAALILVADRTMSPLPNGRARGDGLLPPAARNAVTAALRDHVPGEAAIARAGTQMLQVLEIAQSSTAHHLPTSFYGDGASETAHDFTSTRERPEALSAVDATHY